MVTKEAKSRAQVLEVTSEKQLKAYLHPTRMKIVSLITSKAMTISQVATELKVHPANITHHFRTLEKSGLIKLVEERDIGRTIEKYYRAVAEQFHIQPPEGSVPDANSKVLTFLRNDLNSALSKLNGDDSETLIGLIKQAKISKNQFDHFAERLTALINEFEKASRDDGVDYTLNLSLYPLQVDYGPLRHIEIRKKKKHSLKQVKKGDL